MCAVCEWPNASSDTITTDWTNFAAHVETWDTLVAVVTENEYQYNKVTVHLVFCNQ